MSLVIMAYDLNKKKTLFKLLYNFKSIFMWFQISWKPFFKGTNFVENRHAN